MIFLGALFGWLIGAGLAVGISVGVQYAAWGATAPDWYALPVLFLGMSLGSLGVILGADWGDR